MATYTKRALSGSTNGKGIKVAATATPGTTIHTAVSGTSDWDEIWIYAYNSDSSPIQLTLEWGEATVPDGNIKVDLPAVAGLQLIVPGLLLQNSLVLKAFADTTNLVIVQGFVNRITA